MCNIFPETLKLPILFSKTNGAAIHNVTKAFEHVMRKPKSIFERFYSRWQN